MIDQLSSDPALANSPKFQTLTTGFRNGVARIASRRNGDAFNTKGLAEIADVLDSYRLLVEVGWMRLEEDYNRLKLTNIRGNTSAVLAETHKALTQLPGVLDDPSADEARALDQDMYESSGYEFDAMPSKGKHYDSNSIREMIEKI